MKLIANDNERRLYEMGAFGFVVIDEAYVNLDDLLDMCPGSIVRISAPPDQCIKFFPPGEAPELGCIAGWISEDEQV